VVYSADQGFAMGEHGLRMKVAPYDASYRSTLIAAMPGLIPAGSVCPQTPNATDIVATFHALAGIAPIDPIHGRDLTPLLRDPNAPWPHATLYESTGESYGSDVARTLADAPATAEHQKVPWYVALVRDRWKLVRYLRPGTSDELYDLANDPDELTNLRDIPAHRDRLLTLNRALDAELRRTNAPDRMLSPSDGLQRDPR
jgi:arylsulfatase A-like enzyme